MSIFFDAPVTPDELTAFVREVPNTGYVGPKFTVEHVQGNEVNLSSVNSYNGVARYRSYDGRIHVADRGTGSDVKIKLPALSDSLNQGEYETLQLAFAQTGGTRSEALQQAIYNDAERLTRHVHNRLDLAVGEVISSGKLVLTDETDGFSTEVDYGVPAANLPTASTLWSNPGADVIADLTAWTDAYAAANGTGPATVIMDRSVLRSLQKNTGLIGYVGTNRGSLTVEEVKTLLGSEFGVEVETVSGSYNVDGKQVPVLPADKVVFLPANPDDLVKVTLGVTATALELVEDSRAEFSFEEAPGIVGVVAKEGPPLRKFTFVDAAGLPTVQNPRAVFAAKVK